MKVPEVKSSGMYHLSPLVNLPVTVALPPTTGPNSMYHLAPFVNTTSTTSAITSPMVNGTAISVDPSMNERVSQLSERQQVVLQRLQHLQQQVSQLRAAQEKHTIPSTGSGDINTCGSGIVGVPTFKRGAVCHDMVVSAQPTSPPYSVLALAAALRTAGYTVMTTAALHSSIDKAAVAADLSAEFSSCSVPGSCRCDHQIVISVVWANVTQTTLMVNPLHQCAITGEGNIIRYLCRLFPVSSCYHYEGNPSFAAIASTDALLDYCTSVVSSAASDKKTRGQFLNKIDQTLKSWRSGSYAFSACGDVAVWSTLKQLQRQGTKLPSSSCNWVLHCSDAFLTGLGSQTWHSSGLAPATAGSAAESSACLNRSMITTTFMSKSSCLSYSKDSGSTTVSCNNDHEDEEKDENNVVSDNEYYQFIDNSNNKSNTNYDSNILSKSPEEKKKDRTDFLHILQQLNIGYNYREHGSVMTAEQLMENVGGMPGLHMKNLFLKDKKKRLYLLGARHDAKVQLNSVAKRLPGCKDLRFTDPDTLLNTLGTYPGHVTVYSLINDTQHVVQLVLDDAVNNDPRQYVNFHPMVNTATVGMTCQDLKIFLEYTGHKPLYFKFDDA